MDLVKISAAGGIAAMAALAMLATARPGVAQPAADLPMEARATNVRARIDDAFAATSRRPAFDLSGPVFPPLPSAVPVLPAPPPPAPLPVAIGQTTAWSTYIDEAAARFGLPAAWLHGVMRVESGGRTHLGGLPITSPAGAMGLMQVMPGTFAEMRARYGLGADPYDPRTNILAGAAYLREMYDRYGERHFLAAYNAGPGRVDAWLRGRATLPGETRAYTATLQPRLGVGDSAESPVAGRSVQDLTSRASMAALLTPSSRPASSRLADVSAAPVLVVTSTSAAPRVRRPDAVAAGGLFVTLTDVDRRREASAVDFDRE